MGVRRVSLLGALLALATATAYAAAAAGVFQSLPYSREVVAVDRGLARIQLLRLDAAQATSIALSDPQVLSTLSGAEEYNVTAYYALSVRVRQSEGGQLIILTPEEDTALLVFRVRRGGQVVSFGAVVDLSTGEVKELVELGGGLSEA